MWKQNASRLSSKEATEVDSVVSEIVSSLG